MTNETLMQQAVALLRAGKPVEAGRRCEQLLAEQPEHVPALRLRAHVARQSGDPVTAARSLQTALRQVPGSAELWAEYATVLAAGGDFDGALEAYGRACTIRPDFVEALDSRGIVLTHVGRPDEAIRCFDDAIARAPRLLPAYLHRGEALRQTGRFEAAAKSYRQALELRRGPDNVSPEEEREYLFGCASAHKLRHDIEQLEHLVGRGIQPERLAPEIEAYRETLAEFESTPGDLVRRLTPAQRARLGRTYNRPTHIAAPAVSGPLLDPSLDGADIERRYRAGKPEIVVVDGLLRPEALAAIRDFCLESTVWYEFSKTGGYIGSYMDDGFAGELTLRLAEELRERLPGLLGNHPLLNMWAYRYDSQMSGIQTHADSAAVNVNFWITPDEANLEPERGGLELYTREAPLDWDFERYNEDQDAIARHVAGCEAVRVPYRENRAIVFNSNLFHRTDDFQFRPGFTNRRINITLLYGTRGS
jgi:tetratricopeptide (TPR) repeat protein